MRNPIHSYLNGIASSNTPLQQLSRSQKSSALNTGTPKPSIAKQAMLLWRGDLHSQPEIYVLADSDEEAREIEKLLVERLGVH